MERTIISDLRAQLSSLHKRRFLIVACVAAGVIVAGAYNSLVRPLYQATAVIVMETDTPNPMASRSMLERRRTIEALNIQFQTLKSRGLAESVVTQLELQRHPEFLAGPILTPWARFSRDVLGRVPEREPGAGEVMPAVASLRARLLVEPVPQSSIVKVGFVGYDAETAAAVANTLVQRYIEQTFSADASLTSEASGWLQQRLGEQKKTLGQSDAQLREYEQKQGLLNLDERQRLAEQKLNSLHGALVGARTARIERETTWRELRRLTPEQLEASPVTTASAVVQALKAKLMEQERELAKLSESLGERHPTMVAANSELQETRRRLRSEAQAVLRACEAEYQMALKQEESLQATLEPVQQELNELRQKAVEHGMLKRDTEADQQVLKSLINKSKEAGLETTLPLRGVRILEKAEVPQAPISPRKGRNYQLGFMIGLGLGIAIALLLDQLDDSIRTPDDIKQHLGIPFLGMVPDGAPAGSPLTLHSPKAPLAEAYRVIRTNLIFSSTEGSTRAVLVSSVNPAEGKSTTVANLAVSLAQNGMRVLVVDADLRRPTIHKCFNVASTPGLSDVLVGNATLEQGIRVGVAPRLDVLPCGYVPPDPSELLGSAAMRQVVRGLRDGYDWVLIDAPPILTIADAPVLSSFVDGVLLVVAAEKTASHAVKGAMEQIAGVGGRVLGVVLNRVNLKRNSYYFGRYYGDYYRSYYQDAASRRKDPVATGQDPKRRM